MILPTFSFPETSNCLLRLPDCNSIWNIWHFTASANVLGKSQKHYEGILHVETDALSPRFCEPFLTWKSCLGIRWPLSKATKLEPKSPRKPSHHHAYHWSWWPENMRDSIIIKNQNIYHQHCNHYDNHHLGCPPSSSHHPWVLHV